MAEDRRTEEADVTAEERTPEDQDSVMALVDELYSMVSEA